MTVFVAVALLGAVTAIAMAYAAARRAGATRRTAELKLADSVALVSAMEVDRRRVDDIAHDLSDLLTAVVGHTELLIAGLDPGGAGMQEARETRRTVLSAARLTKSLRALGGSTRVSTDVIDVNAVAARVVASLRSMLGPHIEITLSLDHGIRRVRFGAQHLEEILLNLCIHARDAMPGGGRLSVATAMHRPDARDPATGTRQEYVRLVVADTGTHGSGRGGATLGKMDAIVEQAGGRVHVGTTAGAGATFTIDLPATEEPAGAAAAETPPAVSLLVVEDEPALRDLIRRVLTRAGHEVVTAPGARAALAELTRQPAISLLLVDIVMPDMDGYEVAVEARKISPRIRVVFTSAFAPDPARHPSGAAFLAKPFTNESLTSIVEHELAS